MSLDFQRPVRARNRKADEPSRWLTRPSPGDSDTPWSVRLSFSQGFPCWTRSTARPVPCQRRSRGARLLSVHFLGKRAVELKEGSSEGSSLGRSLASPRLPRAAALSWGTAPGLGPAPIRSLGTCPQPRPPGGAVRFSARAGRVPGAPGRAGEPHVGLPAAGSRKDARRPAGSRTREPPPSRSCPAALTGWGAPRTRKGREREEGPGPAAGRAGRWAPLVDVPGRGALSRKALHPGTRARRPLPTAGSTRAAALGPGPRSCFRVSHRRRFAPRVAATQGWGVGGRWGTPASRPGCGAHGPRPPGRTRRSLSQTPPVLAADLLAAPSPSLAGPRAGEAAAPRSPRTPGDHAVARAGDAACSMGPLGTCE